ncbi:MAG: winged helix-turn-helix domain-containing protein, partial [Candidatus Nanopelagicales bacterium]
ALRHARGPVQDDTVTVGRVSLDRASRRVTVDGEEIVLTATEFDLLEYLMDQPGRVVSRDQLLAEVWGYAAVVGTRTVDVHIAQVRAKLGEASPIRTVRGVGYAAEAS